MRLRYKDTHTETESSDFNIHALSEISLPDDSAYISDLDVFVNGEWKDMHQAFRDRDIVPNNYNTSFGPPIDEQARKRGWNP